MRKWFQIIARPVCSLFVFLIKVIYGASITIYSIIKQNASSFFISHPIDVGNKMDIANYAELTRNFWRSLEWHRKQWHFICGSLFFSSRFFFFFITKFFSAKNSENTLLFFSFKTTQYFLQIFAFCSLSLSIHVFFYCILIQFVCSSLLWYSALVYFGTDRWHKYYINKNHRHQMNLCKKW